MLSKVGCSSRQLPAHEPASARRPKGSLMQEEIQKTSKIDSARHRRRHLRSVWSVALPMPVTLCHGLLLCRRTQAGGRETDEGARPSSNPRLPGVANNLWAASGRSDSPGDPELLRASGSALTNAESAAESLWVHRPCSVGCRRRCRE